MARDLRDIIRRLSPGALRLYKQQLLTLPEWKKRTVFSTLSGIPELEDIIGRPPLPQLRRRADIPLWQKGLGTVAKPFELIEKYVTTPFGAIVTSPFTPSVPSARGKPWLQRELEEYKQAEMPSLGLGFTLPQWLGGREATLGVKGAIEFLPWLAVPSAAGVAAKLVGVAAKGGALGTAAGIAGKAMKPAVVAERAITYPIAKPLEMLRAKLRPEIARFTALPNEEIEKQITQMDWQRRIAQMFGRKPVLKTITEAVGGRAATVTEAVEDTTARALLVGARVQEYLSSKGQAMLSTLRTIHPEPMRLFNVDEKGLTKITSRVEGASKHISDIAEHPANYVLTSQQKNYMSQLHKIEDWVLDGLKEAGIDVKQIKFDEFSHWVHRDVIGKNIDEALVKIIPRVGGRIGAKASWEKARFYETAAEGVRAGIIYEPNLERVLGLYIQSAAKRISDERIAGMTAGLGEKPIERAMKFAPEVLTKAKETAYTLAGAKQLIKVVNRAIRGETLTEATLKAQERRFPELGKRLRDIVEGKRAPKAGMPKVPVIPEVKPEIIGRSGLDPIKEGILLGEIDDKLVELSQKGFNVEVIARRNYVGDLVKAGASDTWAKASVEDRIKAFRAITKATIPEVKPKVPVAPIAEAGMLEVSPLRQLAKDVRGVEKEARAPYWKAKAERQVVMERARTPTLGTEATIMHPAFQGKIYPKDVAGEIQRYWDDMGWGPLNKLATLSGQMRTLVAAADFSAMFIQGLPSIALHPQAWAKAAVMSFKAFKNPQLYQEYLVKNVESLLEMSHYGVFVGGFEFFEAMPALQKTAGLVTRLAARRPQLGKELVQQTYGRFEASFGAFGDVVRTEMWLAVKSRAKTPQELMELSRHINRMTGVMSTKGLGIGKTQRDFEQAFLFFAPRYTRAGIALVSDVFKSGISGAEARKALGRMMAAGAAMYIGTAFALGQMPNFDPTSGQFMTIEITDPITGTKRHFGIGGMMTSLIRFGADVSASAIGAGQNEPLDFVKLNRFDNPFIKFVYSKSAPLTGFMEGLLSGHNFFGEPFENAGDYGQFLAEQVMPIALQSALMEKEGLTPTGIAGEELGLRTFPQSDWEKRDIIRDRLAKEKYNMTWEEVGQRMGNLYQIQLERSSPELQQATQKAQETSSKIARGEGKVWDTWRKEGQTIEDTYRKAITLASKEYEQLRDGRTFREKVDDASAIRRAMYAQRERKTEYTEIQSYFTQPPDVKMNPKDLARREYYKMMYSPDMYDEYGNYKFDEADKREKAFVQKYGQATLDYVEEYMGVKWEEPMPMKVLREAREMLKPYFQIPDMIWSMYPPQLKALSDEIQRMENVDADQARRILKRFPQILRARELIARYRKQMRTRNPMIQQVYRMFY